MSITNSYFQLSWFSVCLNSWEISFPHILHSVFPCCSKITLLSSWVRLASIWLILNVNIPYSIVAFSRAQHARIIVLVHTVWACCFYHPNSLSVWDKIRGTSESAVRQFASWAHMSRKLGKEVLWCPQLSVLKIDSYRHEYLCVKMKSSWSNFTLD